MSSQKPRLEQMSNAAAVAREIPEQNERGSATVVGSDRRPPAVTAITASVESLWRFTNGNRVHSCELRDESAGGEGWLVMLRDNGEPLFGCRCADEHHARFVADCLRRDTGRRGWTEE
jgi:hypothetical protein